MARVDVAAKVDCQIERLPGKREDSSELVIGQAPRRIVADPLSLQHLQPRSNLIARHRTTDSVYGLVLSWDALCTHHGADAGWKGTAASLRAAGGSTRSPTLTGSLISITRP